VIAYCFEMNRGAVTRWIVWGDPCSKSTRTDIKPLTYSPIIVPYSYFAHVARFKKNTVRSRIIGHNPRGQLLYIPRKITDKQIYFYHLFIPHAGDCTKLGISSSFTMQLCKVMNRKFRVDLNWILDVTHSNTDFLCAKCTRLVMQNVRHLDSIGQIAAIL
jgi:hypothetical protein